MIKPLLRHKVELYGKEWGEVNNDYSVLFCYFVHKDVLIEPDCGIEKRISIKNPCLIDYSAISYNRYLSAHLLLMIIPEGRGGRLISSPYRNISTRLYYTTSI